MKIQKQASHFPGMLIGQKDAFDPLVLVVSVLVAPIRATFLGVSWPNEKRH